MQIRWELLVAFVVAGLLTMASVLVFAVFIARKTGASWKYWLYGAVVFIVFQGVLRLPWLIPLNILLRECVAFFRHRVDWVHRFRCSDSRFV
jgi:uncharacterized membrane protein YhfC